MKTNMFEFSKTNHFLYSQWDRSIDDKILRSVLPMVNNLSKNKDIVLAMPSFLLKRGLGKDDKQCLVLIIKNKLILTGYWCDHPNYLFDKEKEAHFQILYK